MQLTIFIKTMLDCLNYMLADNGYYQIDALEYAFYLGVNPVIPDRSESMKNNGTQQYNTFAKCNMPYNPNKKIIFMSTWSGFKTNWSKND